MTTQPNPAQPPAVIELLSLLARRGIRLWRDGSDLRFKAPPGALSADIKDELRRRKGELLEFLADVRGSAAAAAGPPLEPLPPGEEPPLSFAQERLWFIAQLVPDDPSYNIFDGLELAGAVSVSALAGSLGAIFARHQVLRTTFESADGRPRLQVAPPGSVAVPVVDLSGLAPADRAREERRQIGREVHRPFDLGTGPLLRAVFFRRGVERAVLLFNLHHIVSDGWSTGVLVGELAALYDGAVAGRPAPLLALPVQYADFAAWQRRVLSGEGLERQMEFWRRELAGLPEGIELPGDRPRPALKSSRGATLHWALPAAATAAVRRLAREQGVTPFVVLLSAFFTLVARHTGRTDLVAGSPTAGRNRREIEGLIGFFVNTLVLRADLSGEPTFEELLERVRRRVLAAQEHQDLPFEQLVSELAPQRDLSRTPLFQLLFVFQNAPMPALEAPGVTLTRLPLESATTKLDLTLSLTDAEPAFTAEVEYSTDLFDRVTVLRFLAHFRALVEGATADPERPWRQLPMLSAAECHQLLTGWNDRPAVPGEPLPVHELIVRRALVQPDRVAVELGEEALSYGELERRSRLLAEHLRWRGVGPEVPVGVFLERTPELPLSILAVLRAGGLYVPLDPTYPEERLAYMLTEPRSRVMITTTRFAPRLAATGVPTVLVDRVWDEPERSGPPEPLPAVPLDAAVYVIYTSGSTGRPKGVVNHHRALSSFVRGYGGTCAPGPGDRFFLILSFAFDASVGGLFPALEGGATLVLHPAPAELAAREFGDFLEARQITLMDVPVNFWNHWVEELETRGVQGAVPALRAVVAGGEPLYRERLLAWGRATARPVRFLGAYGPTETTVAATVDPTTGAAAVPPGLSRLPIGRPIPGVRVELLGVDLELVPAGAAGEIYLGGGNVTRGYLNDPRGTAEKLVPDPRGGAGARRYRTGDFARFLADGRIEFLGRRDDQVKIRGYRIEPAEVEAALGGLPPVAQAAVVPKTLAGIRQLVAYVVPVPGAAPEAAPLKALLAAKLPPYMVPARFVFLDQLPRNPASDKVDYRALPEPEAVAGGAGAEPRTATEAVLAGLWQAVLGVQRVSVHDGFFDLGGHSLLATQLMSRVTDAFRVDLPLKALFEAPTIAGLARRVDLAREAGEGRDLPVLVPVPRDRPLPASYSQERLWLFEELHPGTPTYNTYRAGHVYGPLSFAALRDTYGGLVSRHEIFRTALVKGPDGPLQRVHPPAREALPVVDLTALPPEEARATAYRLALEDAAHPVPVDGRRLIRPRLLRLGDEEHVFLLSIHHAAYDLWSGGILLEEIEHQYRVFTAGEPARLPVLPVQYADFAVWQRRWLEAGALERQLAYWKEQLRPIVEEPLELPTDRPRPAVPAHRGRSVYPRIAAGPAQALWAVARAAGASQFMAALAVYQALLARFAGQRWIGVGTFIVNRNRPELEAVVGYFDNTVVLVVDTAGDPSFRELLLRVRAAALDAYAHQHVPYETVAAAVRPPQRAQRPLFTVDFIFELNYPAMEREMAGLRVVPYATHSGTAKFELGLGFRDTPQGLLGELEYDTDLFDATTIERFLRHFEVLLTRVGEEPDRPLSELLLLASAECHQLLREWNDTAAPAAGDGDLFGRLEAVAARWPGRIAVRCGDGTLSFGELAARARGLGERLRRRGVGADVPVVLLAERSLELVLALCGVWAAGGAYVPVSPAYPERRRRETLDDTAAPLLLADAALAADPGGGTPAAALAGELLAPLREPAPRPAAPAEALAYVLYTSGSTGKPKGVAVPRGAVLHLLAALEATVYRGEAAGAPLVVSVQAPVVFDASVKQLVQLLAGRTLEVVPEELRLDPRGLVRFLAERQVDVLDATPAQVELLLEAGLGEEGGPRRALIGGEAIGAPLWQRLAAHPRIRFWNVYGPTETTVDATVEPIGTATGPTLGGPLPNVTAHLVDRAGRPLPVGMVGELLLGGRGVARGYRGRPAATAERFRPDPWGPPGARLYATGDLARRRGDGRLLYLGRRDHQVKVRGFRIELGEIESALAAAPGVRAAAVLAVGPPGDLRLVAFAAPAAGAEPAPDELAAFLEERLPRQCRPQAVRVLPELPLTPHGKVDRAALRAHVEALLAAPRPRRAPATAVEERLVAIWAELLGLAPEQVSTDDNFFDLGGHSLHLARLLSRVREGLGVEMGLAALFTAPTVTAMAEAVELARWARGGEAPAEAEAELEEIEL